MRQLFTYNSRSSGYTMVELVVATGVFLIVVSIAVGGFVQALRTQRQAAALIAMNSATSLILEQMVRDIRTGTEFCDLARATCPISSWPPFNAGSYFSDLTFNSANGTVSHYYLDGSRIAKNGQDLTPDSINVRYLRFYLYGNQDGDGRPPRVTIILGVSPRENGVRNNVVNVQTTVSARNIDT